MSPLPLPVAPWHMAQSYPYIFLALAWDSGVGLMGLAMRAVSAGGADGAAGVAGCCEGAKSSKARRANKGFSMRATSIPQRILCSGAGGWEGLCWGGLAGEVRVDKENHAAENGRPGAKAPVLLACVLQG